MSTASETPGSSRTGERKPCSKVTYCPSGIQGVKGISQEYCLVGKCVNTQQLQDVLAQRQLQEEQALLDSNANVVKANAITATEKCEYLKAAGPTVYLSVKVGGVSVEAMVDTGPQSSLHQIGRQMKSQELPVPVLEKPTAHLFGKDGAGSGHELTITAQLQLKIEADGESAFVPVFVQPQSE